MSGDASGASLSAGQIVLVDWRGGALPREPNKRRPAVVIDGPGLFPPDFPNTIVVPLTEDEGLAIPEMTLPLLPTAQNGCPTRCWAASYLVTTASKRRLRATPSSVTEDQLTAIRQQVARAIGA